MVNSNDPFETDQAALPEVSTADRRTRKVGSLWVFLLVALVLIGVGVKAFYRNEPGPVSPTSTAAEHESKPADSASLGKEPTNQDSSALNAKSLEDLKVGPITLEKAKNSTLYYAVGTLRNTSAFQRFGVHVEVALSDRNGKSAGIAKDYRSIIEPKEEWRFRALVLDSKAVSGTLLSVREEN